MGPLERTPSSLATRAAGILRRIPPKPIMAIALTSLLVSVSAFGALELYDFSPSTPSGLTQPPSTGYAAGALSAEGILDTDRDTLPDAIENFVHGTNALDWSTSATGLPDGWLVAHGLDPLDPAIAAAPAAQPPLDALPAAYRNVWPASFLVTIAEAYAWERPATWDEAAQGPYVGGLDPTDWDANDDGIPDGWLLQYELDPRDESVLTQRLAGPDGLTVAEAFKHNTNPKVLDTDLDGVADRAEIDGAANPRYPSVGPSRFRPSDPRAFSSAGANVCDGYLVANGLDPTDPANVYGDLARAGATTQEKYNWSRTRFHDQTCTQGRGLNPLAQASGGASIPDGWLMRYGFDPLTPSVVTTVTQSSPEAGATTMPIVGADEKSRPDVRLTVLDEYQYRRPGDWNENVSGPWWGGTDPTLKDSDGDGISDAAEVQGYALRWTTDLGPTATPKWYNVTSRADLADSDADGATDREEVLVNGTDPSRRDTDADGLSDSTELRSTLGLSAIKADSAGDSLRDGARLRLLESRVAGYEVGSTYEFPGEPGVARTANLVFEALPGAEVFPKPLSSDSLAALLGPGGDADGDGLANIVDADVDGDGLLNGWELDPRLYRQSQFGAGDVERAASDPLNPDTDGDGLRDGWEVEHGRPTFALSPARYALDPSRWDSDENGVPDGSEDPDHDSFEWTLFEQTGTSVQKNSDLFAFPNVMEQQFGTNPIRFDGDEDGLADGWKVYWSTVFSPIPSGAVRPAIGTAQGDVIISEQSYTRFLLDATAIQPGEQVTRTYPNIPLLTGGTRTVFAATGTYTFGFLDAQAAGTNPYLADTSLDGVPDWWAWQHHALLPGTPVTASNCVSTASIDPLTHYVGEDVDNDGLTVVQEYLHGTDPACADSDLDGLPDGDEVGRGLDPADPEDGQRVLRNGVDADGDGLFDFEELSSSLRTNPDLPDTDGDGALDGLIVPGQSTGLSENDPWARLFLDLGIAYTTATHGGERRFHFWGETSLGTGARNIDDSRTGVPAGWLAGHNLNALQREPSHATAYEFGRPAWWTETIHGPWWGGLQPGADPNAESNDRDSDGLEDFDDGEPYEDPIPGVNGQNVWGTVDWTGYPSSLGLAAPSPDVRPWDTSASPLTRRILAQSFIHPRIIANDVVRPAPAIPVDAPVTPCLTVQGLFDAAGSSVSSIVKGTQRILRGRVHGCAAGAPGFHGVTVDARFGSPPQSFGAAFTDADGNFAVPVLISPDHSVALPNDVPVVLRGNVTGLVQWVSDPSRVTPGSNFLTVRTYASPGTEPFTTTRPRLASVLQSLPVTVRADSLLILKVPTSVATGATFDVEFQLLDSAGSPLRDPVRLTWAGQTLAPIIPDQDGNGKATLNAPHSLAGERTLLARSLPPPGSAVTPAESSRTMRLQRPLELLITSLPEDADAGTLVPLRGRVFFEGTGVAGSPFVVNLTNRDTLITQVHGLSHADGSVEAFIPIPPDQPGGAYTVVVSVPETANALAAQATGHLNIRGAPRFVEVSLADLQQGASAVVSGRLVEPDARAISGATVRIRFHTWYANVSTDSSGRFIAPFDGNVPLRPVAQILAFDGDAGHLPASHSVQRAVVSPANLTLQSGSSERSQPVRVPIRLLDAAGVPVQGAVVSVRWAGEPAVVVLTDGDGLATFERPLNVTQPLGSYDLVARFDGTEDGTLTGTDAAATWKIVSRATLTLPTGRILPGETIAPGSLIDASTLKPLQGAPIKLQTSGRPETVATTDERGQFRILEFLNSSSSPGTHVVSAVFPGNTTYGESRATTTISTVVGSAINATVPNTIVLGRPALATVRVTGDDAKAVLDGMVTARIGNATIGSSPVENGIARISLATDGIQEAGERSIDFRFDESVSYATSSTQATLRLLHEIDLTISADPAEAGQTATIEVLVQRGGEAVPFAPVVIQVDGISGGLEGVTDEHGVATFKVVQPPGPSQIAVRYAGADAFAPAHSLATIYPAAPLTFIEQAGRSLPWVALIIVFVTMFLLPLLYRVRRHPLEPIVRRLRRILAGRGEDAQQIIVAYAQLEESAIGLGIVDTSHQTPRTLEKEIAKSLPATTHEALADLMGLFEIARYGTETLGPDHRARALAALDAILDALVQQSGFAWRNAPATEAGVTA